MPHRIAALVSLVLAAGCAGAGISASDSSGGAPDLGVPADDLSAAAPDLARSGPPGPDLAVVPDLRPLKDAGEPCAADDECTSGLCRPLGADGGKICVVGCTAHADCVKLPGSYCAPSSVGSPSGYCMPNSPMHCATCSADADCGPLTDRCLKGEGDVALACHIDCALSGAGACPPDYQCSDVADGTKMRRLCLPKSKLCLDALGGYCDRGSLPQACVRANLSGTCSGQRQCLAGKRYDKCGAAAPQYKMSCADMDPAGCMLAYAPGVANDKDNCGTCGHKCAMGEDCCGGACKSLATTDNCGTCGKACGMAQGCCTGACTALDTVQNCGACGNACPGVGLGTSDVSCADPGGKQCGMTCRGENYDVDADMANGCEKGHPVPPGHTEATPADRGHKDCFDGASTDEFSAHLLSDARVHMNPGVDNFSGTVGSAPDYWSVQADGGLFCVNDYDVTFSTAGGGGTPCYTCTIITNKKSASVTISGAGSANMNSGAGSYSGGTTIYFKIEKTCNLPVQEDVSYKVHYHL